MPVVGLAALAIRFPFPLLVVLCSALWTSAFIQPQSRWPYISVASLRPQALNMLKVALTRENGANDKLWQLLHPKVNCYEIPCIMFDKGADVEQLGEAILEYDVVVITSPQGAKVFLESWRQAGSPSPLKVVTVGKGTSKPLMEAGIEPVFEPSDSTAATLAQELPRDLGESVLYAASALADNRLVEGLLGRGFSQVTRLNTYTTVPAVWSEEQLNQAKSMDIVTFASPSAVRTWVERVGSGAKAVVIGPTSAVAARKAGFKDVFSPSVGSKGLVPWADLVVKVASS